MKDLSKMMKRLRYLMIEKLPEYIDKINKEENDGIIIKPFTNTEKYQETLKKPYFDLSFNESEQGIKDRIIGFVQYKFVIEFFLENTSKVPILEFCRYRASIIKMIEENFEYGHYYTYKSIGIKKLILAVCVEW